MKLPQTNALSSSIDCLGTTNKGLHPQYSYDTCLLYCFITLSISHIGAYQHRGKIDCDDITQLFHMASHTFVIRIKNLTILINWFQ